ncbi:MAG: class I SAM-dependent methyltransferase [Leptospiraceae bacterium]|nr:class I SAM-dependent methyltransferase [Leptospiraceae bacterium]NUM41458.1 class I SAM-dependent methyltransferase [Leptospiraceae bacterium]
MKTDLILQRLSELFPEEKNEIETKFDFNKILKFYEFLQKENLRGGFFSKKDTENILERHLIESIYHVYRIVKEVSVSRETKLADVGTGPGLPGFLFYCLLEFPKVTLIDSQRRKLSLLEKFAKEEKFSEIQFIYSRAEEKVCKKFDIIVTRSVVSYPWSAEVCINLLNENGYFIPFLGKFIQKKEDEIYLENLGLNFKKVVRLSALGFLGERHLIFLKKTAKIKQGYPRSWKSIKEEMRHNGEDNLN